MTDNADVPHFCTSCECAMLIETAEEPPRCRGCRHLTTAHVPLTDANWNFFLGRRISSAPAGPPPVGPSSAARAKPSPLHGEMRRFATPRAQPTPLQRRDATPGTPTSIQRQPLQTGLFTPGQPSPLGRQPPMRQPSEQEVQQQRGEQTLLGPQPQPGQQPVAGQQPLRHTPPSREDDRATRRRRMEEHTPTHDLRTSQVLDDAAAEQAAASQHIAVIAAIGAGVAPTFTGTAAAGIAGPSGLAEPAAAVPVEQQSPAQLAAAAAAAAASRVSEVAAAAEPQFVGIATEAAVATAAVVQATAAAVDFEAAEETRAELDSEAKSLTTLVRFFRDHYEAGKKAGLSPQDLRRFEPVDSDLTLKVPVPSLDLGIRFMTALEPLLLNVSTKLNGIYKFQSQRAYETVKDLLAAYKAVQLTQPFEGVRGRQQQYTADTPAFDIQNAELWISMDPAGYGEGQKSSFGVMYSLFNRNEGKFWVFNFALYKKARGQKIEELVVPKMEQEINRIEAQLGRQFTTVRWIHEQNLFGNQPLEIAHQLQELLTEKTILAYVDPAKGHNAGVLTSKDTKVKASMTLHLWLAQGLVTLGPLTKPAIRTWLKNLEGFKPKGAAKEKTADDVMASMIAMTIVYWAPCDLDWQEMDWFTPEDRRAKQGKATGGDDTAASPPVTPPSVRERTVAAGQAIVARLRPRRGRGRGR